MWQMQALPEGIPAREAAQAIRASGVHVPSPKPY